jgi:hypothetical protein
LILEHTIEAVTFSEDGLEALGLEVKARVLVVGVPFARDDDRIVGAEDALVVVLGEGGDDTPRLKIQPLALDILAGFDQDGTADALGVVDLRLLKGEFGNAERREGDPDACPSEFPPRERRQREAFEQAGGDAAAYRESRREPTA